MKNKKPKFSLYWVEDGHSEDWFVISPDDGCQDYHYPEMFHDNYEGHEPHTCDDMVAPFSNADYVCDVPFEILNRLRTGRDNEMTYIEQSKKQYITDVETVKDNKEFFFECIYPDFTPKFKKELKEFNMDYDKIIEYIWDSFGCMDDYCEEIFSKGKSYHKKGLASCMLENEIRSDYDGYGCFHGQIDILKEIEGMTIIDDGTGSSMRVVAYDGKVYSEGDMEAQIQDVWKMSGLK